MSEWKARRFWKTSGIRQVNGGWEVVLDDRPVKTPGKLALILPTEALARAVAAEWEAQADIINPTAMPITRAANSAIEKVAPQFAEVAKMLAEYGGTDLLCFRAEKPQDLVQIQADGWDDLIDWSASELQAPLRITHGVIPVPQSNASLDQLRKHIDALDVFGLTALHDLVTLPGSLILGLAVIRGKVTAQEAHRLSRLDEVYQADMWGTDADAEEAASRRRDAMLVADLFWKLSRPC